MTLLGVPGVPSSSGDFTMARKEKKTPVMCQKQLCKPWHCTRVGHGELGGIFQLHISVVPRDTCVTALLSADECVGS